MSLHNNDKKVSIDDIFIHHHNQNLRTLYLYKTKHLHISRITFL